MSEIKERPILFSAPMVRALLAGEKTQTRRVMKPQPVTNDPAVGFPIDGGLTTTIEWKGYHTLPEGLGRLSPYGAPGDRLWVKETHRFDIAYDTLKPTEMDSHAAVWYEADGAVIGGGVPGKTRVSLHMQHRFSRILLEIVSMRAERLMDCSESDALAEGVIWSDQWQAFVVPGVEHPNKDFPVLSRATAREMYAALWDTINGSGMWLGNPWVWVVEFKRVPQ